MDDECIYCHGEGMDPDCDLLPCPYCDGTGGGLGYGYEDYGYEDEDWGEAVEP